MASRSSNPPCLICLQTPAILKVVPTCQHAFCSKCLTSHVQNRGGHGRTFPCPVCHADCPLPKDGVQGLQDSVDITEGADMIRAYQHGSVVFHGLADVTRAKVAMCEICHYDRNVDTEAELLCDECGSSYLCRDCALVHGKYKATASHVLFSLKNVAEGCCKKHKKVINRFCSRCSEPCCHLCILLAHGNHEVIGLDEVFHSLVDEVKDMSVEQARRSKELKKFSGQLDIMKSSELAQRKGVLVQELEDHAEVCIGQIIKQKESLKDQVEDIYKLFTLVSQDVEKAATIGKLGDTLAKADTVLAAAEPTPKCVRKLVFVKQEMSKYGIVNEIDIDKYQESYKKLEGVSVSFLPNTPACNIGALSVKKRRPLDKLTLVYENKLKVDDPAKHVPCVTVIDSDFYAVADTTVEGRLSDGFDIYKFPGVLRHTFKKHPKSLYDMAAYPDGHLAALSPAGTENACQVFLFHPVSGYVRSLGDFPVYNPLSFDINNRRQFLILCNYGGTRVTVCNEDGSVALVHHIDESIGINDAFRIACSHQYVYVIGRKLLAVFEWKDGNLVIVTTSGQRFNAYELTDISVTDSDEVTLCYERVGVTDRVFIGRYVEGSILSGYQSLPIDYPAIKTRLSAQNDYVLTSQGGSTIRIYRESA